LGHIHTYWETFSQAHLVTSVGKFSSRAFFLPPYVHMMHLFHNHWCYTCIK
jgi:hypothetical protein